jgi:hypothetical protein
MKPVVNEIVKKIRKVLQYPLEPMEGAKKKTAGLENSPKKRENAQKEQVKKG